MVFVVNVNKDGWKNFRYEGDDEFIDVIIF